MRYLMKLSKWSSVSMAVVYVFLRDVILPNYEQLLDQRIQLKFHTIQVLRKFIIRAKLLLCSSSTNIYSVYDNDSKYIDVGVQTTSLTNSSISSRDYYYDRDNFVPSTNENDILPLKILTDGIDRLQKFNQRAASLNTDDLKLQIANFNDNLEYKLKMQNNKNDDEIDKLFTEIIKNIRSLKGWAINT
ncbi:uncharacterized protein SCDLUD_003012 [Saccharomycodes ludwigii]|uniref:uncharacterized protein n=1 Tax=Saccharomycodes ludwigii TaxID=36035 RepID=UPI001E833067|nr:hypothetical protein SCDLUD_003012 [Saccharomycodes ludwigii]KAH3901516.1 hypothetical protein SCDLUD_003012 [Saccharomycodes ludwigii]